MCQHGEASPCPCVTIFAFDVFLSFRGDDTRGNFVSHLYKALMVERIRTFKDDKELRGGSPISLSLHEAIEKSRLAIVIFSQNYAFSSWCLDELVKITECRESKGQIILPIFYKVDPTDVCKQTGIVAKAFEEHEKYFEPGRVRKWKEVLSKVSMIAGLDSQNYSDEAALIECIIKDVFDRLVCSEVKDEPQFVSMYSHLTEVDKLLDFECNNVRMVGIWGVGGIGKSTIADAVYRRAEDKFEVCCSLKDIATKYKRDGAVALQKELISRIFSDKNLTIWDADMGCDVIRRRLHSKKVLILLDDIDELQQLKILANSLQWFGQGSRILVTSRDKGLLLQHGVKHIYEVPFLKENQALQLFSLHAFKRNHPPNEFMGLSKEILSYCNGLPLPLVALGSFLRERDLDSWQSTLETLQGRASLERYKILKLSYDGLDDFVKEVFLDISFFFTGCDESTARDVLNDCGFHAHTAFEILQERALVKISSDILYVPNVLGDLAYEIVKREYKIPARRSRLWNPKDIYDVLAFAKSKRRIEGMSLNMSEIQPLRLKQDAFRKMDNLRILKFYMPRGYNKPTVLLHEDLNFLPDTLRYLHWDYFPVKSLPANFLGRNLVQIRARGSNMKYLWKKKVELKKLRLIDLSYSKHLKALPDLTEAINLEVIEVEGCESLIKFPSDLSHLYKLHFLNLCGCEKLYKLPKLPSKLKRLNLSGTAIAKLPDEFQYLTELEELWLYNCGKLTTPIEFGALESLSTLALGGASIKELPQHIDRLKSLQFLYGHRLSITGLPIGKVKTLKFLSLEEVAITELQQSVCELTSLENLELSEVPIRKLPEFIGNLRSLVSLHMANVVELTTLPCSIGELQSLRSFYIGGALITELPLSIVHLQALCYFILINCVKLVRLPNGMCELISLKQFYVRHCNSLSTLPMLPPALQQLRAEYCDSLETVQQIGWCGLQYLEHSSFVECKKLDPEASNGILERSMVRTLADRFRIVVPGSNIPDWFQYKICASSVTLKLPSALDQIRGLAFCAVLGIKCTQVHTDVDLDAECYYTVSAKTSNESHVSNCEVLSASRLNHVVLWYDHDDYLGNNLSVNYLGCDVQFDFKVFHHLGKQCNLTVKKCGVYLIPNEKIPQSISNSLDKVIDYCGYASEGNGSSSGLRDQSFANSGVNKTVDENCDDDGRCYKRRKTA